MSNSDELQQPQQEIYSLFQPTKNSTVPMQLIQESSLSENDNFVFQDFNNSNSPHAETQAARDSAAQQHYTPIMLQQVAFQGSTQLFSIDTSYIAPRWTDEQVQICSSLSQNLQNSSQSFSTQSTHSQTESPQRNKNYRWSEKEDTILQQIMRSGQLSWKDVAQRLSQLAGTQERTADQVSQHWIRVLNPAIQKGRWTKQEDEMLIQACKKCTPKQWKDVSLLVQGRTDIQCRYRLRQIGSKLIQNGVITSDWL